MTGHVHANHAPAGTPEACVHPTDLEILASAFDDALQDQRLVDRNDPLVNIVAMRIIELAHRGERHPLRLREYALQITEGSDS